LLLVSVAAACCCCCLLAIVLLLLLLVVLLPKLLLAALLLRHHSSLLLALLVYHRGHDVVICIGKALPNIAVTRVSLKAVVQITFPLTGSVCCMNALLGVGRG
jgi:hypothetical protein